jgi:selenocysteine lyase/cysteine desulfurase
MPRLRRLYSRLRLDEMELNILRGMLTETQKRIEPVDWNACATARRQGEVMKTPVYLDYLSTTPVDPAVAEAMAGCLTLDGTFGNPASRSHRYGWEAEMAVENARQQIAALINADLREIVFTSGATEADNLAIKGVVEAARRGGRCRQPHVVTSPHRAQGGARQLRRARGARASRSPTWRRMPTA